MVDPANQIGSEKVMPALGVNAAAMPEPGQALTHDEVRVLEVKPSDCWTTAETEREYEPLLDRHGTPRAVLVDGAVERRGVVADHLLHPRGELVGVVGCHAVASSSFL